MITKKDIQYVYDVISKSPDIQKLIKDIANSDRKVHDVCDYRNNDNEKDILKTQISDLKNELQNANVDLNKYKLYYDSTKSKVEEYDSLKNEVSSLQDKVRTCNSELERKKEEMEEELESANEITNTFEYKKINIKDIDNIKPNYPYLNDLYSEEIINHGKLNV